ncbi:hypothetical protein [Devosia sp. Root436]|uniref:hypothetical protein n=1 Tax=Devosia sp. Root436 TaxID=1736537 RepID=UPI0012E33A79|nr:hypothetical protein [Devosia sp. Root436]
MITTASACGGRSTYPKVIQVGRSERLLDTSIITLLMLAIVEAPLWLQTCSTIVVAVMLLREIAERARRK